MNVNAYLLFLCLQPTDKAIIGIDTVTVEFVSGNLKNNLMTEKSFLYVEKLINISKAQASVHHNVSRNTEVWSTVSVDADWETQIKWCRINFLPGQSTVEIKWAIPIKTVPGLYRIRHVGFYKVSCKMLSIILIVYLHL